jgi:asparagine synthase (glutamine-hydrolysing)
MFILSKMCGILVVFKNAHRAKLKLLERRGPDERGYFANGDIFMGHTRLSIVHPEAGAQPIFFKEWVLVINGELYNAKPSDNETDCYMLIKLINEYGTDALQQLDGIFSFVAYHRPTKRVIIGRDPIGVTPLYWSETTVSSLLACMGPDPVHVVPPGSVADFTLGEMPLFKKWTPDYAPREKTFDLVPAMQEAVTKRLMGDVPWGVLLSGGLDSTIVAALAVRMAAVKRADFPIVHSFCIGMTGSPDIAAAEEVANELGTHHTTIQYTVKQGIAAIHDVIGAVETYDVTTIRASTPMWLLGRALKRRGIKMVLSGEGSDELFAGYLYNLYCPSPEEMDAECRRKMNQLHAYDCQRANKSMGDWGVETRVPFLDKKVVDYAMNVMPPVDKMSGTHPDGPKAEKWWLREQFADIVPKCVLNRTKAQFSDAVGSAWIDACRATAEKQVTDEDFSLAHETFPHQTPDTKEAYWYRSIFEQKFRNIPEANTTVLFQPSIACSTGIAVHWNAQFQNCLDPSGDAVEKAIQKETNVS